MAGIYTKVARVTEDMKLWYKQNGVADVEKALTYKGLDIRGSKFQTSANESIKKAFADIGKTLNALPFAAKEPEMMKRLNAILASQEAEVCETLISVPSQDVFHKTHSGLPEKIIAPVGAKVLESVGW